MITFFSQLCHSDVQLPLEEREYAQEKASITIPTCDHNMTWSSAAKTADIWENTVLMQSILVSSLQSVSATDVNIFWI